MVGVAPVEVLPEMNVCVVENLQEVRTLTVAEVESDAKLASLVGDLTTLEAVAVLVGEVAAAYLLLDSWVAGAEEVVVPCSL